MVVVAPMFVERKVHYSVLFTNLVGWHVGAVSFPLSDAILAELASPLSDVMFCLHSGINNLSLYKHWVAPGGRKHGILSKQEGLVQLTSSLKLSLHW